MARERYLVIFLLAAGARHHIMLPRIHFVSPFFPWPRTFVQIPQDDTRDSFSVGDYSRVHWGGGGRLYLDIYGGILRPQIEICLSIVCCFDSLEEKLNLYIINEEA